MSDHESERAMIAEVHRFVDTEIRPKVAQWNRDRHMPSAIYQRAAVIGLTGLEVPKARGGGGFSFATKAAIAEIMAEADFGVAMAIINTQNLAKKLADHTDTEMVAPYLKELLAGTRIGCTALTEPGAGSDFGAITTRAHRGSKGWILNGEKAWITNAAVADSFAVYAQTKEIGDISGVAAFLVDGRREGFERGPPSDLIDLHTICSGSFRLVDYIARDDEMFAPPGQAFKSIMRSINGARIYVAAMCCGMLRSSIAVVDAYGRSRKTFGKPLHDHQGWRWYSAEAVSELAAIKALVDTAADQVDAGNDTQLIAAQTKIAATRAAERHIPRLAHLMGAEGLNFDNVLARHMTGVRLAGLVDGSTEMLLERVAKLASQK